jgi:hypothetical protein
MMDDVVTPRRSITVVVRAPGRRFPVAFAVGGVVCAAIAVFAARGTGYAFGPAPQLASLEAPSLPSDPGAARKLKAKLVGQNKQIGTLSTSFRPRGPTSSSTKLRIVSTS